MNHNGVNLSNEVNQLNKDSVNNFFVSEGSAKSNIQNSSLSSSVPTLGLNISDVNALDLSKISTKNSVDLVNEVTTH